MKMVKVRIKCTSTTSYISLTATANYLLALIGIILTINAGVGLQQQHPDLNSFKSQKEWLNYYNSRNLSMCKDNVLPAALRANYTNLLTFFTTFKPSKEKYTVYNNTLHNWAAFLPHVQPVLYTNELKDPLVAVAKKIGWKVFKTPRANPLGTPYLKDMYSHAQKHVKKKSAFYGFSNGDIMFTEALLQSLRMMENFFQVSQKCLMMVGTRRNYKMVPDESFYTWNDVQTRRWKSHGFSTDAEDYFIIARNFFPWKITPDIVIGRPGYDNFMVGYGKRQGVNVVDITRTNMALHQTDVEGNRAGAHNKDGGFNKGLIRRKVPGFNYHDGLTGASNYYSVRNGKGKFRLRKRRFATEGLETVDAATRKQIIRDYRRAWRARRRQKKLQKKDALNALSNTNTTMVVNVNKKSPKKKRKKKKKNV